MANPTTRPLTLPQKVWDRHMVNNAPGDAELLYIDLHLVHEVTSPQAFDGLRINNRKVRRPDLTVATVRSGRRTLRLLIRSPSKACGLVTS